MAQLFPTQSINSATNTTAYPIYPSHCGFITLDAYTGEIFYQLRVTEAGSIVWEGKDGVAQYIPYAIVGAVIPVGGGRRVLTSATIDGQAVTTSATGIWWYGGQ